jgi:K+-transporting ATPase KdpF subunit
VVPGSGETNRVSSAPGTPSDARKSKNTPRLRTLYNPRAHLNTVFIRDLPYCMPSSHSNGGHHGRCVHRPYPGLLRRIGGPDPILRKPDGQRGPLMNWVYWLSGAAALGIFIYLVIALFKPELFE